MIDPDRLATLVQAKMLHDLASPIGTIGNAIELIDDKTSVASGKSVFDLLRSSANSAMTRLRLNRCAYAMREESQTPESLEAVRGFFLAALENNRVELIWNAGLGSAPALLVKFLANLTLLALECAPRGGKITVELSHHGGRTEAAVDIVGPQASFQPHVTQALSGQAIPVALAARDIQAFYVRHLADKLHAELSAREEEGRVRIAARMPEMAESA